MFIGMIWRPTTGRTKAFRLANEFWTLQGSVRYFDSMHDQFNRAASRNATVRAAEKAGARKLVITDADCIPETAALEEAWEAADDGLVHLPYTTCLVEDRNGEALAEFDFTCGGVYVTTVEAWWAAGGQDERFTKWAPEDMAFWLAHRTLLGAPMVKHAGRLISMGHERDENRHEDSESDELVQLYRRYEKADGDREAMETLCSPWS